MISSFLRLSRSEAANDDCITSMQRKKNPRCVESKGWFLMAHHFEIEDRLKEQVLRNRATKRFMINPGFIALCLVESMLIDKEVGRKSF